MVSTLPHPNGIETTRNIEFANGDRATVGDLIGKRTTWKSKSTPIVARWHRDPAQQCMKTLAGTAPTTAKEWNIGNGSVNGIRFVTIERGSGTYSYALDFGCAQVASKTGFGANTSGHELIGLIPGEPDATLFHVPPEFEETDPLAFAQAMRASMRLGPLPEACERKTRDYADIYRKQ
ncbi:MAG: hypothetical protein R2762_18950 [Bryobacteraceae bacterium]